MKQFCQLILVVFLSFAAHSQAATSTIKGCIIDSSTHDTLIDASVTLLDVNRHTSPRLLRSSVHGFAFRHVPPGFYKLCAFYSGYARDTITLSIAGDTSCFITFYLVPAATDLMEVVLRSSVPPVIIRNDTIRFNTSLVPSEPNATIEDLLKKLPGIQVDKEGNITLHGKRVEKLYIDGKEFFLNDPKAATRNLNADMIDAIEAFDNQSERARLTGIRDLNTGVAINLRLKKDRKKGTYGNATLHAGTRHTLSGNAVATTFKNDRWTFANISANRQDIGNIYKQSLTNGAFNFREQLSSKVKLVINYQGLQSDQLNRELYLRQTFFGDSSILQKRAATRINELASHNITFNAIYDIDSFTTLRITPSLSFQQSRNKSLDSSVISSIVNDQPFTSSRGVTANDIQSRSHNVGNIITLQKRAKKRGRTFYVALNLNNVFNKQNGDLFSQLLLYNSNGYPGGDRTINQRFLQSGHNHNTSLNLIYTEPINARQVLDFGYTVSYEKNVSSKNAFDFNPITGHYDIKDTLTTNNFTYKNTQQTYSLGYNFIGSKLQYQAGINLVYNSMSNISTEGKFPSVKGEFLNWSPLSSLFYQLAPQQYLQLQYQGNSTSPSTEMLQPIPDLSNPYLVKIGNPYLRQQFDHSLNIQYNTANSKALTNSFFQFSGKLTQDKIVPASSLSSNGIQTLQYLNLNGTYNIDGSFNYNVSLNKGRNGTAGVTSSMQYNRDVTLVNNLPTVMRTLSASQQFSINYQHKDKLSANASATIRINRSVLFPVEMPTQTWLSQSYMCYIGWNPFKLFRIQSDINAVLNGRQGGLPANKIITWNIAAYRLLFRQQQGEIRVSAFDLLRGNRQIMQATGANFFEFRQASVIQQYFTVSFRYNFKVQ